MTLQNGIYVISCELCGRAFRPKSLKSFSGTMRYHRKTKHPDHVGTIRYNNVEKDK